MDEIKEDIDVIIENSEKQEILESFVLPVPLTTEEIKEQIKQEDENFIQTSLAFREEELRVADEIADEENKNIVKSIVDPAPGPLVNYDMDFQDINFSPDTTDNLYKLPPKVEKYINEMVIDAILKIEQDFI